MTGCTGVPLAFLHLVYQIMAYRCDTYLTADACQNDRSDQSSCPLHATLQDERSHRRGLQGDVLTGPIIAVKGEPIEVSAGGPTTDRIAERVVEDLGEEKQQASGEAFNHRRRIVREDADARHGNGQDVRDTGTTAVPEER